MVDVCLVVEGNYPNYQQVIPKETHQRIKLERENGVYDANLDIKLHGPSLFARFRSRKQHTFAEKILSAMRFGFGGHVEGSEPIDPEPKPKDLQSRSAGRAAQ